MSLAQPKIKDNANICFVTGSDAGRAFFVTAAKTDTFFARANSFHPMRLKVTSISYSFFLVPEIGNKSNLYMCKYSMRDLTLVLEINVILSKIPHQHCLLID